MRVASLAVVGVMGSMIAARTARAEEEAYAPSAYGVLVGELAFAGVFAANFNNVWPNQGPALMLNFTPLLLGPAAGLGAHYGNLDARPALALHGAGWMGLNGFLIGALIDGRARPSGLRVGGFAWTLGAIGAIAGGVIGATAVDGDREDDVFLGAPPAGFAVGGLVLGGLLVIIGGIDGDAAPGQFATGAVLGMTIGLGVSTYFAYRGSDDDSSTRVQPSVQGAALSDQRATIFSVGGGF